ncbi:arrestin domain-containing protein 3-like [Physella acuta]|uniref:arrestin domain-containing protein 3-like n=1 Tax=Physella acuta TaxID=109671 RepID=UPI0027DDEAFF|nr:arrestin domain-containing protein 3-like [Physella acuta]XP_059165753.1 arrestin domain-containing protein 3-like [Physella acuta]
MAPHNEIIFEPDLSVYITGSVLRGRVCLHTDEKINTKGIQINFRGECIARWAEGNIVYRSEQIYLDRTIVLLDTENDVKELSIGKHEFPFQVELEDDLPSTFSIPSFSLLSAHANKDGRVFYSATCTVVRSWSSNIVFKREFRVFRHLDLNKLTGGRQPVQVSHEKNVCCLCCMSGPIHVDFTVDKQLYVPGEDIRLSAEVVNGSNRKIKKCSFNLIKITTFHGKHNATATIVEIVASIEKPGIMARKRDSWSNVLIKVPQLFPSYLQGCSVIDLNYIVELHVKIAGPTTMLKPAVGVVIGSIPLAGTVQ